MSYCAELCQKYPDRFIGNFTYNPRFGPENGAAELEFHVKEYGFKMLKLHANMHSYRPDRALDWLRPAMRKCDELGVVVLIHTGDGPYSIPTQFYPIIREFPNVRFIIGHFGIQTGGVYCFEAFWMTMDTPNVWVESGWCLQSRIVEFAKELPKHKLVFGTDSPPNEPGMWIRHLEVLCIAAAAGPEPRRGDARGLPGQQHREARRHQADPAAEDGRGGEGPPHRYVRGREALTPGGR